MSRRKLPGRWITRKDGSRSWRLTSRDPDTAQQKSRLFETKGDAEVFHDELNNGRRAGTWVRPDAGRERLVDYGALWADAQDWAPTTRESFASTLRRLGRYLGDARLDQIDKLRLQRLRTDLT